MKNPFRIYKDKYIWYCKACWLTGAIGTNPDTLTDSVRDTCYAIHKATNIGGCTLLRSNIVVHKHIPMKRK